MKLGQRFRLWLSGFFKWGLKMKAQFLMKFGKGETSAAVIGQEPIESDNLRSKENGIQETATKHLQKSGPRDLSAILSSASTTQSLNVEMVSSPSMSLLDDTSLHLFNLMKREGTSVNDACNCAKQMYSIMRLKLDAIKTQLGRDKK